MLNVLPTLDLLDNAIVVYWGILETTVTCASSVSVLRVTALNASRMDSGLGHIL